MSCVLQSGHSGDCALNLCRYNLRNGDIFVLNCARVIRGSISSQLVMCGGGVHSMPADNRCIWYMFVLCLLLCSGQSLGVLKYGVCLYRRLLVWPLLFKIHCHL